MLSIETGPPTLETIQARLGLCLFLLSSSRANQCWYIFGTTIQLVTALGLHRRRPSKTSRGGPAYIEHELRKRVFWSAYTLDKYLSVMFGRPRLLDDEDIDQDLPDEVNDEVMSLEAPREMTESTDCMMIASVLHYRFDSAHSPTSLCRKKNIAHEDILGSATYSAKSPAGCIPPKHLPPWRHWRLRSTLQQSFRSGRRAYILSSAASGRRV